MMIFPTRLHEAHHTKALKPPMIVPSLDATASMGYRNGPDLAGLAAANGHDGKSDDEIHAVSANF
jgi:hypothetical protein